jgi:hypothetical protein
VEAQHEADLARSVELTMASWRRSAGEQALAWAVWTLAGQRWARRFRRSPAP